MKQHRSSKPRLLYIITRAERGGAQSHVLDLACGMRRQFEVCVATGEHGFLTEACREKHIAFHVLPHLQREIRPVADALALREIQKTIARFEPDLVHAHTFKAGFLGRFAARIAGIPSIYTLHTWLFGTAAMPRTWSMLGGPCERMAAGWGDRVITVSHEGARVLQKQRIPGSKVVTIHNGIPDCSERASIALTASPTVIMVARFTEVKEHDILLRAFASLPTGPRLRLVGDGPLRRDSEKLAHDLGIRDRVEFLGNRHDVPSLLANSDIFVLASKFEMLPISVLEAMRAGLPVIASDVGGVREVVVDGQSGVLVPSGSVEALSTTLHQITSDLELRRELGHASRLRFVENFLYARQEECTRVLYFEVLSQVGRVALQPEFERKAA